MPAPVTLVEATPRVAASGAAQTVRLAGGGASVPYRYGGNDWRAGLDGLPRSTSTLDFDGEQLGGGGVSQALELRWGTATNAALAAVAGLFWTDAPVTVRIGPEDPALALPPVAAAGLVLDTSVEDGRLRIALGGSGVDLKRALLTDRFGGTGGADGPVEWAGKIRTRGWGRLFNVPGECIDKLNNIWCFGDPTRAWQAFDQLRDQGVPAAAGTLTTLAWAGSVAATFTALQAAVATAGGGVRCPSIACVKWWTAPLGDLHADVRGEIGAGYVETAPELAARIVAARSTLTFAAGAVAAAAAVRAAPAGWRVASDGAIAADEVSALLAGVSLSWTVIDGAIEFRPWDWTASTRAARSHGVTRRGVGKPVAGRRIGYRQNQAPMSRGDLAGAVLIGDVLYPDGSGAAAAIATAASNATSALSAIAIIQSDGYLSAGEKPDIIRQWSDIAAEYPALIARLAAAGVADGFNYNNSISALSTYLSSLSPAWNNAALDTAIVPATFNGKFSDYYYSRTLLLNAIDAKAATTANNSGIANDDGKKAADYATADVTFTASGNTAPTVLGNKVKGNGTGANWDGFAASTIGLAGPCRAAGRLDGPDTFIGLSTVQVPGSPGTTYPSLNYSVHHTADGSNNRYVFIGAAPVDTLGTARYGVTFTAATKWETVRLGETGYVFADGVFMSTSALGALGKLYAAAAFAGTQAISEFQFGPYADVQVSIDGPATIVIAASAAGTPTASTTTHLFKRLLGTTDVSASTTWSIAASSGCTVSVSGGVVSRSGGLAAQARFTLRSVRDGIVRDLIVTFNRDDAAPSYSTGGGSGSGTAGSGNVSSSTGSNSYGATGSESAFSCVAGSSGQVALTASIAVSINRTSGGSTNEYLYGKLQWRIAGGTWADVAAETASDVPAVYSGPGDADGATITLAPTKTGLTSGTTYEFRFLGRRGAATSAVTGYFSGTVGGTGS